MPGCGGTDFCPFQVFKDKIVEPHLKHDYDTLCNANLDKPDTLCDANLDKPDTLCDADLDKPDTLCNANLDKPKHKPEPSKLSRLLCWLFGLGNDDAPSHGVEL